MKHRPLKQTQAESSREYK